MTNLFWFLVGLFIGVDVGLLIWWLTVRRVRKINADLWRDLTVAGRVRS
jgi:uncharacterized membrane-anchored protein YhcB (DUF1043 family)